MNNLEEIFTRVRPIQDYVAVVRVAAEKQTRGGLYIPDSAQKNLRAFEGRVVAVGPGRFGGDGVRKPAPNFKVGDHVFFGRYAGGESALIDEDFWLIREAEIDAVLEP
jgi:chaperonin GroES